MLRGLKFRAKFILIFLLIGIIPMLTVSVFNYIHSKKEFERVIRDGLSVANNSRVTNINQLIALRQEQAKEFAGSLLFKQLNSNNQNDPQLIEDIQKYVDSIHRELKLVSTSNKYKEIDQASDIEIIAIWDFKGDIIASTNKEIIGGHMPPEYLEGVRLQGIHFGGYQVDPATGKKYLLIIDEIKNITDNKYAGSVLFLMKSQVINDIVTSREGLGQTGETYLVDDKMRMLTRSRFVDNQILKIYVDTQAKDVCFEGKEEVPIYKNYQGNFVLGVSKKMPDLNWCLITEMSVDEAFTPIRRLRDQAYILAVIFIVIILLLAFYASNAIIQPILKLNRASKNIAKGNYADKIVVQGKDELGELTLTFNEMSQKLEDAKKALVKKNEELIKTLNLTNEQKKELEKINLELDRYVYTVSHDIGSPISGIMWCGEHLKKKHFDQFDAESQGSLVGVIREAEKLKMLTTDLLKLTKISRIRNPYQIIGINQMVNSVLERMEYDIKMNNVQVKVQSDMPAIICDRIKIEEVLYNLINNGIKFSSKIDRQAIIQIGYNQTEEMHEIFVQDNGIGISPENQKEIFGVFKQLSNKDKYSGSGVGLHIVQLIVNEHGGDIRIESQVGEGTAFFVQIAKNLQENSQNAG